jgi:hypothetical protein
MARKKVVKFCPRGHEMELAWRKCPRCTGSTSPVASSRDITERTVFGGQDGSTLDATVVVQSGQASSASTSRPAVSTGVLHAQLIGTGGPAEGRVVDLYPGTYRIGKAPPESEGFRTLELEGDGYASRHHATLTVGTAQLILVDAGSTNGTHVNGDPVTRAILKEGDAIRFGESTYRVKMEQA